MVTIGAIIGGIATIVGAVYGVFKWVANKTQKSLAAQEAEILQRNQKEEQAAETSGRPQ